MKETESAEQPYYQHDLLIGEVRFWRDDAHTLRLPRTPDLDLDGTMTIECQSSRIW